MPSNNLTQNGVIIMDNLNHHKIAQANELVEAVAKMDTLPMKLFELAVGAVDSTAASDQYRVARIDKQLVLSFLPRRQAAATASEQRLADAMQRLREKSGFELTIPDENGGTSIVGIQPITRTATDENKSYIEIAFAPEIMPYITELKKNFTQYSLEDISNLGSRNAIAIYKILMEHYNQAKRVPDLRRADTLKNPVIDVSFLRQITEAKSKYPNFADFNRYIISKAVTDINQHTSFTITYDKIKSGRYVTQVQFHLKGQHSKPSGGPTAQSNQPVTADLTAFLTNHYTAMLMANQLINPAAITTNEALRLDYLTKLYPLYAKFTAKYDDRKLQQHLAYVAEHQSGDANLDYLVHALADYQNKLAHPASQPSVTTNRPKRNRIQAPLPAWARDDAQPVIEPVSDESIRQAKEALARLKGQLAKPNNQ